MAGASNRVRLTAGRVASFHCPDGKTQGFLWDTDVPALLLRATPTGRDARTIVQVPAQIATTPRVDPG